MNFRQQFVLFILSILFIYCFGSLTICVDDILDTNLMPASLFVLEGSKWINDKNSVKESRIVRDDVVVTNQTGIYDAFNIMQFHR